MADNHKKSDNNKDPLSLNKLAAAVLVAGLIAMLSGTIARVLYKPEIAEKRGYYVEVAEANSGGGEAPAAVAEPDIGVLLAAADVAAGQKVSGKCTSCHAFEQGGANKVGPALYGILNSGKAAHAGFAYSDALKAKGGTWDYAALNEFLKNPKAYVPGTKMAFVGLKKPEDRANLILYLRSLGKDSVPLPAAAK
jgi:cytochrome c